MVSGAYHNPKETAKLLNVFMNTAWESESSSRTS